MSKTDLLPVPLPPSAPSRLRARLRLPPYAFTEGPAGVLPKTKSGQTHTQSPSAQSAPSHPPTRQRCGVRNEVPLDRTSRHQPPKKPRADHGPDPVIRRPHLPNLTHSPKAKPHPQPIKNYVNHVNHVQNLSHPLVPPFAPSRLRARLRSHALRTHRRPSASPNPHLQIM